jgi:amino acid permease
MKNIIFILGFILIIIGCYFKITDHQYANWLLIIGIVATLFSYSHIVNSLKQEQKRVNEKLKKK